MVADDYQPKEMLNTRRLIDNCGNNTARAEKLVKGFLASLPDERADFERAFAIHDLKSARERAHRLQTSSRYVGAERLAAAAQEVEQHILAKGSQDEITAAWRQLRQEFQIFVDQAEEALLVMR